MHNSKGMTFLITFYVIFRILALLFNLIVELTVLVFWQRLSSRIELMCFSGTILLE